MVYIYFFLFILYLGLTVLYAVTSPKSPPLSPWPLLPVPTPLSSAAVHCQVDDDCEAYHVCLSSTCVPKLLKGGQCNPQTGRWISYYLKKVHFAICTCLNPELFTQNFFGGDCTVNVGCGVHGQYDPQTHACRCHPGYKSVQLPQGRLTCQKVPVFEQATDCGPDELPGIQLEKEGFDPTYETKHVRPAPCVKRPCSFDALSGRPLKHGKWVENWGCVCDPRYGLFGVVLKGINKTYLKTEGFDACASILVQDPPKPIDVKLVTYFYLGNRDPVSLILFDRVSEKDLIPLLRGQKGPVIIQQSLWRYDYAQHYFKTHRSFRARTRAILDLGIFGLTALNEFEYKENFTPRNCAVLPHMLFPPLDLQKVYRVLYENPVCLIHDPSEKVALFQMRIVVNPQHFTFQNPAYESLDRFNAFVLHYDAEVGFERWTLDLGYPYNVHQFRVNDSNVPKYVA